MNDLLKLSKNMSVVEIVEKANTQYTNLVNMLDLSKQTLSPEQFNIMHNGGDSYISKLETEELYKKIKDNLEYTIKKEIKYAIITISDYSKTLSASHEIANNLLDQSFDIDTIQSASDILKNKNDMAIKVVLDKFLNNCGELGFKTTMKISYDGIFENINLSDLISVIAHISTKDSLTNCCEKYKNMKMPYNKYGMSNSLENSFDFGLSYKLAVSSNKLTIKLSKDIVKLLNDYM